MSETKVHWYPWGREAFALAAQQQKPVLLSISASWCHWCHVMDQTSYSDDGVVSLIEQNFIPVRVDTDHRPDINERYNQGGWPTTAFLTGEGEVLYGATYVPPRQMAHLLDQVATYYRSNRGEIDRAAAELRRRQEAEGWLSGPVTLDQSIVDQVLAAVRASFDPLHGGFGREPKFPFPEAIDLVLEAYLLTGQAEWQQMARQTLDAMAHGGIMDHVEGGFFRYSTDREWRVPHFEKMLEGNAGLLGTYTRAFLLFREPFYAQVASDVVRYVERTLADPEGGFYGSQDADEHYYSLNEVGRAQVQAPQVDRTLYTSWNGQFADALFLAAAALERDDLRKLALKSVERLLSDLRTEGGSFSHFRSSASRSSEGYLSDQVWATQALLDAYAHTGRRTYLEVAQSTVEAMSALLWDANRHIYRDRNVEGDGLGRLSVPAYPLVDNSWAARVLLQMHLLTGVGAYHERAMDVLSHQQAPDYGLFATAYASVLQVALEEPWHAVVVGPAGDPAAEAMRKAFLKSFTPALTVEPLDPVHDRARLIELGYPADQVAAYLCVGQRCLAPATSPQEVATRLQEAGEKQMSS